MSFHYTLRATASDLSVGGAVWNLILVAGPADTPGTQTFNAHHSGPNQHYAFTQPGIPSNQGVTGNYSISIFIVAGDTTSQVRVRLARVNASGAVQTESGFTANQALAAGLQTHTFTNLNLGTWATNDRLRIQYEVSRSSGMGSSSATLRTGADTGLEAPWTLTAPVEPGAASGSGVGSGAASGRIVNPLFEEFADDFDRALVEPDEKWPTIQNANFVDGICVLSPITTAHAWIETSAQDESPPLDQAYALRGSYLYAHFVGPLEKIDAGVGANPRVSLTIFDGYNWNAVLPFQLTLIDGLLTFTSWAARFTVTNESFTLPGNTPEFWLRLREEDGSVYGEVSTDFASWNLGTTFTPNQQQGEDLLDAGWVSLFAGQNTQPISVPLVNIPPSPEAHGSGVGSGRVFAPAMEMVWDTTLVNGDPIVSLGATGNVDCFVDWGDGSSLEHFTTNLPSHTYASHGTYTVRMSGSANQYNSGFGEAWTTRGRLVSVDGLASFGSLAHAFNGCLNLESFEVNFEATSGIASFFNMFRNCRSITSVPIFDTSSGTDFRNMFYSCVFLSSVPIFDMSSGTNFQDMFYTSGEIQEIFITGVTRDINIEHTNLSVTETEAFLDRLGTATEQTVTVAYHVFPSLDAGVVSDAEARGWIVAQGAELVPLSSLATDFSEGIPDSLTPSAGVSIVDERLRLPFDWNYRGFQTTSSHFFDEIILEIDIDHLVNTGGNGEDAGVVSYSQIWGVTFWAQIDQGNPFISWQDYSDNSQGSILYNESDHRWIKMTKSELLVSPDGISWNLIASRGGGEWPDRVVSDFSVNSYSWSVGTAENFAYIDNINLPPAPDEELGQATGSGLGSGSASGQSVALLITGSAIGSGAGFGQGSAIELFTPTGTFAATDDTNIEWTAQKQSKATFDASDSSSVEWNGYRSSVGSSDVDDSTTVEWIGFTIGWGTFTTDDNTTVEWMGSAPSDEGTGQAIGSGVSSGIISGFLPFWEDYVENLGPVYWLRFDSDGWFSDPTDAWAADSGKVNRHNPRIAQSVNAWTGSNGGNNPNGALTIPLSGVPDAILEHDAPPILPELGRSIIPGAAAENWFGIGSLLLNQQSAVPPNGNTTSPFTIAVWVECPDFSEEAQRIGGRWDNNVTTRQQWFLGTLPMFWGNTVGLAVRRVSNGTQVTALSGTINPADENKPMLVVVRYTGTHIQVYTSLGGWGTAVGDITGGVRGVTTPSTSYTVLGHNQNVNISAQRYKKRIGDFLTFNRSLSDIEVAGLAQIANELGGRAFGSSVGSGQALGSLSVVLGQVDGSGVGSGEVSGHISVALGGAIGSGIGSGIASGLGPSADWINLTHFTDITDTTYTDTVTTGKWYRYAVTVSDEFGEPTTAYTDWVQAQAVEDVFPGAVSGSGLGSGSAFGRLVLDGSSVGSGVGLGSTSGREHVTLGVISGSGVGESLAQGIYIAIGTAIGSGSGSGQGSGFAAVVIGAAVASGIGVGVVEAQVETYGSAQGVGVGQGAVQGVEYLVVGEATGAGIGSGDISGIPIDAGALHGTARGFGSVSGFIFLVLGWATGSGEGSGAASGYIIVLAEASGSGDGFGFIGAHTIDNGSSAGSGVGAGQIQGFESLTLGDPSGSGLGSGALSGLSISTGSFYGTARGFGSAVGALSLVTGEAKGSGQGLSVASGHPVVFAEASGSGEGQGSAAGYLSVVPGSVIGSGVGFGSVTALAVAAGQFHGTARGFASASGFIPLVLGEGSGFGFGSAGIYGHEIRYAEANGGSSGFGNVAGAVAVVVASIEGSGVSSSQVQGLGKFVFDSHAIFHIAGNVASPTNALGPPDGVWTTNSGNQSWDSRFEMAALTVGQALYDTQEISVRARKSNGLAVGNPTLTAELWENGSFVSTLFSDQAISNTTSQDVVGTFEAEEISNDNDVEIKLIATGVGTLTQSTLHIDAITWTTTVVGIPSFSSGASGSGFGTGDVNATLSLVIASSTGSGVGSGSLSGHEIVSGETVGSGIGSGQATGYLALVPGEATGSGVGSGAISALAVAAGSFHGTARGFGSATGAIALVSGQGDGSGVGLGSLHGVEIVFGVAEGSGVGSSAIDILMILFGQAQGSGNGLGSVQGTESLTNGQTTGSGVGAGVVSGVAISQGAFHGTARGFGSVSGFLFLVVGEATGSGQGSGASSGHQILFADAVGSGVGSGEISGLLFVVLGQAEGSGAGSGALSFVVLGAAAVYGTARGFGSATGFISLDTGEAAGSGSGSGVIEGRVFAFGESLGSGSGSGSLKAYIIVLGQVQGSGVGSGQTQGIEYLTNGRVEGSGVGSGIISGVAISSGAFHGTARGFGSASAQLSLLIGEVVGFGLGAGSISGHEIVFAEAEGSGVGSGAASGFLSTLLGEIVGSGLGSGLFKGTARGEGEFYGTAQGFGAAAGFVSLITGHVIGAGVGFGALQAQVFGLSEVTGSGVGSGSISAHTILFGEIHGSGSGDGRVEGIEYRTNGQAQGSGLGQGTISGVAISSGAFHGTARGFGSSSGFIAVVLGEISGSGLGEGAIVGLVRLYGDAAGSGVGAGEVQGFVSLETGRAAASGVGAGVISGIPIDAEAVHGTARGFGSVSGYLPLVAGQIQGSGVGSGRLEVRLETKLLAVAYLDALGRSSPASRAELFAKAELQPTSYRHTVSLIAIAHLLGGFRDIVPIIEIQNITGTAQIIRLNRLQAQIEYLAKRSTTEHFTKRPTTEIHRRNPDTRVYDPD